MTKWENSRNKSDASLIGMKKRNGSTKEGEAELLKKKDQTKYRSGVGKLLHMMKWSRPEIMNSICELSRFMSAAT